MLAPVAAAQFKPGDFDVTDGKIAKAPGNRLQVSTKEMRATLKHITPQNVTVNFTYRGPTKEVAHLGSGEVRSQFGIKLRAQDTCNIVYVMWHFAPDQKIAVSVKRNPGQRTHQECLDHGYITSFKPRISANVRPAQANQPHTLAASLNGSNLTVTADGTVVWEGDLGSVALEFDGPVGLRSDNARVIFDFLVNRATAN
ncbi:MAG TPA: hypothetical protein VEI73_09935 [Candidatus Acidoferrum sp.]|nr:hypothetical protein [Candidatus Acidoferrum sp.]